MTKKLDGALFEEPAVAIGCPDWHDKEGVLHSGFLQCHTLQALYGGVVTLGRYEGEPEHCLLLPLKRFAEVVRGGRYPHGIMVTHLEREEYIAVFYRHPRNPKIIMCGMRKSPKLFLDVWSFIQNEDTDMPVRTEQPTGQDGLLLDGVCFTSNARAE